MHVRKQSHSFFQAAIWSPAASNLLCVLLALLTHVVTALTPIATHGMAYATIEESIFIIQGGGEYQNATSTVVTNQLFTVNLTLLSWDATNPPWEAITIPSGFTSMTTMWHSISLSRDLQTLTFWDSSTGGSVVSYERDSGKWSISNSPEALQNAGEDIKAVTDPNTGHIYLPLGYYGYNMLICEPEPLTPSGLVANTTLQLPSSTLPVASAGRFNFGVMPEAVRLNATGYSFIWSSSRQSLLLFGGRLGNGGSAEEPYFHEFNPNSAAWNVFETAGGPPRLIDSCMVEAYNGTKIIIFGGHQVDGFSIGDIYIYDFPTKAWNKGPSIDSLRSSHACSVAGDNLLVWGGIRKLGLLPEIYAKVDGPMQIYNIYKNQWVQTYERANHYNPSLVAPPPPATLTPPETDATKKNKTSEAVVVAVPLAIVLVLLVVGLIYIYRRKPEFFRRPIPWDKHDDHFDSPGGPGNQLVISSDSREPPLQPQQQPSPSPAPPAPLPPPHSQPQSNSTAQLNLYRHEINGQQSQLQRPSLQALKPPHELLPSTESEFLPGCKVEVSSSSTPSRTNGDVILAHNTEEYLAQIVPASTEYSNKEEYQLESTTLPAIPSTVPHSFESPLTTTTSSSITSNHPQDSSSSRQPASPIALTSTAVQRSDTTFAASQRKRYVHTDPIINQRSRTWCSPDSTTTFTIDTPSSVVPLAPRRAKNLQPPVDQLHSLNDESSSHSGQSFSQSTIQVCSSLASSIIKRANVKIEPFMDEYLEATEHQTDGKALLKSSKGGNPQFDPQASYSSQPTARHGYGQVEAGIDTPISRRFQRREGTAITSSTDRHEQGQGGGIASAITISFPRRRDPSTVEAGTALTTVRHPQTTDTGSSHPNLRSRLQMREHQRELDQILEGKKK